MTVDRSFLKPKYQTLLIQKTGFFWHFEQRVVPDGLTADVHSTNKFPITIAFSFKPPLDYGTSDPDKVVLLTDGSIAWYDYIKSATGDYTPYDRLSEGRLEIPRSIFRRLCLPDEIA